MRMVFRVKTEATGDYNLENHVDICFIEMNHAELVKFGLAGILFQHECFDTLSAVENKSAMQTYMHNVGMQLCKGFLVINCVSVGSLG